MIGILADSHDNLTLVRRAVTLFNDAGCDLVIHAGDFVAPFAATELRNLACPVRAVYGNCDGERAGLAAAFKGLGEIREAPFAFSHGGLRFLVSHLDAPLARYVAAAACDVIVYGHTHRAATERRDGILLINPGEAGGWLRGRSTAALFDPAAGTAEIVGLA